MHRTRAERRSFLKNAKRKARRIMRHIWGLTKNPQLDPKTGMLYNWGRFEKGEYHPIPTEETISPDLVGKEAATHCAHGDRWWKPLSKGNTKERRSFREHVADITYREEVDDLFYDNDQDLLEDESDF